MTGMPNGSLPEAPAQRGLRTGLTPPRRPRYVQRMAALFRRRSTSKESPTLTVRLWGLPATYLVGVAAFVTVALLRGDDTLWSALITGAIVIGFGLGGSLWVGRMTRSDQGRLLLVVFSTLFALSVGVMLWRGFFNWSLFALAIAGLFFGLGGFWVTRQEP